jgi:sialidase-1
VSRVVHQGPAAYSSLAALADGSIAVLFERGDRSPYERITLARLPFAWLAEGRGEAVASIHGGRVFGRP